MIFKTLKLKNIQSYTQETVHFDTGDVLIYGENGAGKTTILRALFGALFQEKSASRMKSGYTLDKLVRNNEDIGEIELTFGHDSEEYTIEWVLKTTTDANGERTYDGTERCVLTSAALDAPIEGNRSVRRHIKGLVGMDAQSFVNSVYVQQGDITRLLYASNSDRKDIIDGLLGLNEIDEKIDRLDKSRLGVNDKLEAVKTSREDLENRLEELPDVDDLNDDINARKTEKKSLEEKRDNLNSQLDDLRSKRKSLQQKRESIADKREKLEELKEKQENKEEKLEEYIEKLDTIEEKRDQLSEKFHKLTSKAQERADDLGVDTSTIEDDIEDIDAEIQETKEELADLNTAIETKKMEVEQNESELEDLEGELSTLETEKASLTDEIETLEETIEEKEDLLESKQDTFDSMSEELQKTARELSIPIGSLTQMRDEGIPTRTQEINDALNDKQNQLGQLDGKDEQIATLQETGECPVCGETHETVEELPTVEKLSEQREAIRNEIGVLEETREDVSAFHKEVRTAIELKNEKDKLENEIDEAQNEQKSLEDEREGVCSEISDVETAIQQKKEEVADVRAELSDRKTEAEEVADEVKSLKEQKEKIESVKELTEKSEEVREEANDLVDEEDNVQKLKSMTRENVDDLQTQVSDLEDELEGTDFDSIDTRIEELEADEADIESELDSIESELDSIRDEIADLRNRRDMVQEEKEREKDLKKQYQWLEERKDEILEVQDSYRSVKKRIRSKNIELLNKFTNEVFTELHQGRSISSIEIDEEYDLELVKPDNSRISPDMSSGGESNTINLALRTGLYRLIAERDGRGELPPFILDEPTQFLDTEHISELQSFIRAISKWDVPQLLVVSHEDKLIEAANCILHVEIDRTNGESSVTKEYGSGFISQENVEEGEE